MKKNIIIASLFIGIISIALIAMSQSRQVGDVMERYQLNGLSTVEMVNTLEAQTINPDHLIASISATTLTLTTQGDTLTYDVPDHLFYLSVAPYINHTHPCGTHNLTTCRAELANQSFQVTVTDEQGQVIVSETMQSHDNGFIGIWLPRGINGTIDITYNGLSATTSIHTHATSHTCLTTMRLQ